MRYFIIFTITIILALFIAFYKPYLYVYNDSVTIEYNYNEPDYRWEYDINNNNLSIKKVTDNKWILTPKSNGKTFISFKYVNNDDVKYTINYEFKVSNKKIYWINGEAKGLLNFPNPYWQYFLKLI